MDEILGREVEELNGIQDENMLSTYAEKRLEDGDIGLVPDASDAASQEETDAWSKPEPKEHKISHESRGQRNEPLSFGVCRSMKELERPGRGKNTIFG